MSSNSSLPNGGESPAQAYVYPPPLVPGTGTNPPAAGGNASTLERLWVPDAKSAGAASGPPPITEEQIRAREAQARKQGRDEGVAQGQADFERKVAAEKQALAQTIREFGRERESYFQRVEAEVVGLAVAIARKILHREAQVDPLLLAGVVRVGLDQVARGTHVRLRVYPDQIHAWRQFFAQQHDLESPPELLGDATLGPGHCLLETDLGTTDLTLESQLKEIEQGFFDLLAQRPKEQ